MLERYFEKAEILTSKLMLELTSKNKRSNINSGELIYKKKSVSTVSSQLSTLSLDSLEFPINSVVRRQEHVIKVHKNHENSKFEL